MFPKFSRKKRNFVIFSCIILSQLLILQFSFFLYNHYFSDNAELLVLQTNLENKLFHNFGKRKDYVSVGNHSHQQTNSLLLPVAEYYCGLPVPKGIEGSDWTYKKSNRIGTIVLIRGSTSLFSSKNVNESNNFYAYLICAQQLMQNITDAKLSRYFALFGKALSRDLRSKSKFNLSKSPKCAFNSKDVTTHALLRAYAIGSRLATVYRIKNAAALKDELIVTTINSQKSKLEGLAILAAILNTWAGNDEKQFELYSSSLMKITEGSLLKESAQDAVLNNQSSFSWLKIIDNPRFCVPETGQKSCRCPRMSLSNAITQRLRTAIMLTLRNEVNLVQTGLKSISPRTLPPFLQDDRYSKHPDWPHMTLNSMIASLCHRTWPFPIQFTGAGTKLDTLLPICSSSSGSEKCIPENLLNRLWRITTHIDDKLGTSDSYLQHVKLASFPFLKLIKNKILDSRLEVNAISYQQETADAGSWLLIYVGQFDSIKFLLRSLTFGQSDDLLYTAGRFSVELHSIISDDKQKTPEKNSGTLHLRFLLDGEDITMKMPFCKDSKSMVESGLCPATSFISYLENSDASNFWNFKLDIQSSNDSLFEKFCYSASVNDRLPL